MPNSGQNQQFFAHCDLEIWQMTLENNRAPHLTYFKYCASFHSHWLIQTVVTVRKRRIWVKIGDFLPRVTLKLDKWPLKRIGHLFYATSSFLHHFIDIGQYKLWSYSPEPQILVKIGNFLPPPMTLKYDRWPWKMIGHFFYTTFLHHFIGTGQYKLESQSRNAKFGSKSVIFCPMWPRNLTDDFGTQ